ncbi:MAG TPA: hypothetical protein DCL15_23485 [Chloroflexi bacterium]|nr:hypothetical protein [Chloroflexota bacterium]HHW85242.1 S8 family serine peptidase [Chloroflexota bacterium]
MNAPAEFFEESVDLDNLPWIVWVQLQPDALPMEYMDNLEEYLRDRFPEFAWRWEELLAPLPELTFQRTFFTLNSGELAELVERQAQDKRAGDATTVEPVTLQEFFSHYFLPLPSGDYAAYVAEALQGLEHIFARVQVQVPLPVQPAGGQPYLGGVDPVRDTVGINVRDVWGEVGGNGENTVIGVIEQCWALTHRDLTASNIATRRFPQIQPANNGKIQSAVVHAMADVGILAAAHNAIDFDGIAAGAAIRLVSSIRAKNGANVYDVADAITVITQMLPRGAVLLVEEQAETLWQGGVRLAPAERVAAVHTAIRAAVNSGVAVIEPAGNGDIDIDAMLTTGDSGAIMVGACADDGQHPSRLAGVLPSNYGLRVDCYALGEFVETLDLNNGTRPDYGGTSAASAIIAGAAAVVLSIAAAHGRTVTPPELRDWFRQLGADSLNPGVDRIGVMPDVGALIAQL